MSNYRAIATVTAVLRHNLERAFEDVDTGSSGPAASAMTVRPDNIKDDFVGVNIFLYQITPNAALRNADLPTRSPAGGLVSRPQTALDLHYLLSFYGKETDLTPQILLGRAVSFLHGQPMLTREDIRALAVNSRNGNPRSAILSQSQLEDQVESVKFFPRSLDLEELSKLWSVFFQTPYTLSTVYQASVVLIEGEGVPETALPVRSRGAYLGAFQNPQIERIVTTADGPRPILPGDTLVIQGRRLKEENTKVRLGEQVVAPESVGNSEIRLPVPPGLRAGVHGVQVIHEIPLGTPPEPHVGSESNLVPIVLSPRIKKTQGGKYILKFVSESGGRGRGRDRRSGIGLVTLTIEPAVEPLQRALLLLNQLSADQPKGYSFPAPARLEAGNQLQIPVWEVLPGSYLVRVRVDGAASPLDSDDEGRFASPLVEIT